MAHFPTAFALLVLAVALCGCATHMSETKSARASWEAGNFARAQSEFASAAEDKSDTDILVWRLEEGAAARASGDLKKSAELFSEAERIADSYDDQPQVSITRETAAFLANQSYLPYKGYNYDKIFAGVYSAANYIELKEFDRAAVELIRLDNVQRNSQRRSGERMSKEAAAISAAGKNNASYDASRTLSNPDVYLKLREIYGADFSAKATASAYSVPFAYWLAGVFFMNRAEDSSDRERAADMFRFGWKASGGKSEILAEDFNAAEDFADGKTATPPATTYIVYETGCAPARDQFKINLPLYLVAHNVPHVGVNFPILRNNNSFSPDLRATANGQAVRFETLADVDAIVRREFMDALPLVLARTILSSAAKAAAQYAAARSAGDGWAGLAVNIAGSVYQYMTNDADLRTWTTLPKQIKLARFPTPADGIVNVDGRALRVPTSGANIIWVKRTGAATPASVRIFDFKDGAAEKHVRHSADARAKK